MAENPSTTQNPWPSRPYLQLQSPTPLGQGSFAKVWKAIDTNIPPLAANQNAYYAIKQIDIGKAIIKYGVIDIMGQLSSLQYHRTVQRLLGEVTNLKKLQSENVVKYYDHWFEGPDVQSLLDKSPTILQRDDTSTSPEVNFLFIQMEFCHGTLRQWLTLNPTLDERDSQLRNILLQLATGLNQIHQQGITHRDLKPDNIFYTNCPTSEDNSSPIWKIGDFGFSRKVEKSEVGHHSENSEGIDTHSLSHVGCLHYRSPEMHCKSLYNKKSDVFSLGLVFYEVLHQLENDLERKTQLMELVTRKMVYIAKGSQRYPNEVRTVEEMLQPNPDVRLASDEVVKMLMAGPDCVKKLNNIYLSQDHSGSQAITEVTDEDEYQSSSSVTQERNKGPISSDFGESLSASNDPPEVHAKTANWRRTYCSPPVWSTIFIRILIPILIWTVLYLLLGDMALPGSSVFSICILHFPGIGFGQLISYIRLPPQVGMLTLGIFLRNNGTDTPVNYGTAVSSEISSVLRQMALVVILIRAGLGLDPQAFMRLKGVVIRLAFYPFIAEALPIALASHFILSFPWLWGLMLGFVLAAASPAVIVPSLLTLREQGYGVKKGTPTMVMASSIDDILAISAFGLVLALNFAKKENTIEFLIQGPLELILGIVFGILWGCLLGIWFSYQDQTVKAHCVIVQVILTLGGGCLSVFGFQKIGFPGSGPLGCLTATFVAAGFWRQKGVLADNNNLTETFSILWFLFQPLLFGLIGCEIDFKHFDSPTHFRIICLLIGSTSGFIVRLLVTLLTVAKAGLNFKERLFVSIAWVPNAAIQVAIGQLALDTARSLGEKESDLRLQLLIVVVAAILIIAFIRATAVALLRPCLLSTYNTELKNGDIEGQLNNQAQDEANIPLQPDPSKSNSLKNLPNGENHVTK